MRYLAVIASLLAMRVVKRRPRIRGRVWTEMTDGWRYVVGQPLVRAVLMLLAVSSMLGGSYSTLLPLVAHTPRNLGILMAAAGLGALSGALYLANRRSVLGLGAVIGRCSIGLGAGMVLLRFAPNTWSATPFLFLIGASLMVQLAATNTIIQTIVDQDRLGRVISLYGMVFFGGAPLGAFALGTLADQIGVLDTFSCAGAATILAGFIYTRRLPEIRIATRPLYQQLGLID